MSMAKLISHEIYVPQGTPSTEDAFKDLIEKNGHIFEGFVMSKFRGDGRYQYQKDSLTVNEINHDGQTSGSISFNVDVQYFDGCKDKDYLDQEEYEVDFTYEKNERLLKFELDETIWNPDN
jgi:hypothetical protein